MEEGKVTKPKKPIFKKWWFWVIVVFFGLIAIGQLSEDDTTTQGNTPASTTPTPNDTGTDSETEVDTIVEESEPEDDNNTITEVGQGIQTKNFRIGVEGFRKPGGNSFLKPGDGKEFVDVIFLIENISDKDYNVSSIIMFDAYADGFSVNQSITALAATDDISSLDGSLAAGKKMRGKLSFELPVDWEELEIDVDLTALSFSTDGEIKVILQNPKE